MTARAANVVGVKFDDGHLGGTHGGIATISFDLNSVAFTGGADTITMGGTGFVNGVATTDTLGVILSKFRRDGKTVTIYGVMPGPHTGSQAAATNGPEIWLQAPAVSANNVISTTLKTAATGGSDVTAAASAWERPASLCVYYVLS